MNDLFSSPAQEAKAEAIARVEANAPSAWLAKARQVTMDLAKANPQGFTSDSVWWILEACGYGSPPEPRALGAVFQMLAREKIIVKTGEYRDSERAECHGRPIPIWRLGGALDNASPRA